MPTIIATVGAVDANSFGTLAEAIAYHATVYHPDTPWPSVQAIQEQCLILAQQQMTAGIEWTGYPTTTTQKLPWPRTGMWTRNEVYVPNDSIPDEVKWVQFELARLLANSDRTEEFQIGAVGLTHLRAGPVTMKFKESDNFGSAVIPRVLWDLLPSSWYCNLAPFMKELLRA